MKLVITGALGHIGSRFLRALPVGMFSDVLLLDNFRTQRHASLLNLPENIPYRFHEADIVTADLTSLFQGADAVVHLAAVTESAESHALLEEIEKINQEGTRRVAAACAELGARLLFPSSTSVYGSSREIVDESGGPEDLQLATPYSAGKLASERDLAELRATHGLRYAILRLGTIFGTSPGMRFHTAVNRFTRQAFLGEPLTVWNTAMHQQRPYLDVGDAAEAFLFFLKQDLFEGEVFNVLTVNTTVSHVIDLLKGEFPELAVRLVDSPAMSPHSFTVSDAKVRAAGFVPQGSLSSAIRDTVKFLKENPVGA